MMPCVLASIKCRGLDFKRQESEHLSVPTSDWSRSTSKSMLSILRHKFFHSFIWLRDVNSINYRRLLSMSLLDSFRLRTPPSHRLHCERSAVTMTKLTNSYSGCPNAQHGCPEAFKTYLIGCSNEKHIVAVILTRSHGLSGKHMKIVRDLRLDTATFISR